MLHYFKYVLVKVDAAFNVWIETGGVCEKQQSPKNLFSAQVHRVIDLHVPLERGSLVEYGCQVPICYCLKVIANIKETFLKRDKQTKRGKTIRVF